MKKKPFKILVLIDCQNDFITGSLANLEAQKAVPNIVDKIKSEEWDCVITTQDTHSDNYLKTSEGKKLPVKHCIKNTDGWKINSDISNAIDSKGIGFKHGWYKNVLKCTFGSLEPNMFSESLVDSIDIMLETFYAQRTPLSTLADIYNDNIEIHLCGFCTDICVISNALILKSNYYSLDNLEFYIDASCCAGVTPKKHKAALEVMKSCQINVINEQ